MPLSTYAVLAAVHTPSASSDIITCTRERPDGEFHRMEGHREARLTVGRFFEIVAGETEETYLSH